MSNSSGKSNEYFNDGQLAKATYLRHMSAMKEILDLGLIKFGDKNSEQYKYFKRVVMDSFYNAMSDVFQAYEREGLVRPCDCGTGIRNGYKPCPKCNGSGHCNSVEFDDWFKSTENEAG